MESKSLMRRLMLLRHAKSDWSRGDLADRERPLAPRGRNAAPKIGAYMARHALEPDLVLCSPALRTRQTLELVLPSFNRKPDVAIDDRLYGAGSDELLEVIREADPAGHSLLLIGHNPGLQDFAELIIATGEIEARQQLNEKYPTAGLVVIDFAFDHWRKLHPQSGRLDRFVTPQSLAGELD